jgi:hypothetical protein
METTGLPKYPGFGHMQKVPNVDAKFGSAAEYTRILVKNEEGEFETLLLTDNEIARIRERVYKSPEEGITPNIMDKMRA